MSKLLGGRVLVPAFVFRVSQSVAGQLSACSFIFLNTVLAACSFEDGERERATRSEGMAAQNIILIVADDLGWRDNSVYGSTFYKTPSLERLAATGVTFDWAYSASPLCSPTRASIMTGQYPGRLGFTSADGHLADERLHATALEVDEPIRAAASVQSVTRLSLDYTTLAEVLKDNGYSTAFVGKWHLGSEDFGPDKQGFDVVVGGGEYPGPPGGFFAPWPDPDLPRVPDGTHIGPATTQSAIDFMERAEDPFFLTLFQFDVHAPYQAIAEDIEAARQRVDPDDPQQSPTMAAMVASMDRDLGTILDYLEESGLSDNTAVLFLSDNGGNMYDEVDGVYPTSNLPLRAGKGSNYEGGVRVPFLVRWPGLTEPGVRTGRVVSTVDFFPSILDALGLPLQPTVHVDGESFVPALRGSDDPRGPIFSHMPHNIPVTGNRPNASVLDGRFKLYRFFFDSPEGRDRFELYDLEADPGEALNLASAQPEKVAELSAILDAHLAESGSVLPQRNQTAAPQLISGWRLQNASLIEATGDSISLVSTGADPWILTDDTPQFASPVILQFDVRSTASGPGRVYWSTYGGPGLNEETALSVPIRHDGEFHSYELTIPADKPLREVRIDPAAGEGEITLRNLRLTTPTGYVLREWAFWAD